MLDVHDERVRGGPPLQLEDPVDRLEVLRVRAEAVYGLGGKGDHVALAQREHREIDLVLGKPGRDHP